MLVYVCAHIFNIFFYLLVWYQSSMRPQNTKAQQIIKWWVLASDSSARRHQGSIEERLNCSIFESNWEFGFKRGRGQRETIDAFEHWWKFKIYKILYLTYLIQCNFPPYQIDQSISVFQACKEFFSHFYQNSKTLVRHHVLWRSAPTKGR